MLEVTGKKMVVVISPLNELERDQVRAYTDVKRQSTNDRHITLNRLSGSAKWG